MTDKVKEMAIAFKLIFHSCFTELGCFLGIRGVVVTKLVVFGRGGGSCRVESAPIGKWDTAGPSAPVGSGDLDEAAHLGSGGLEGGVGSGCGSGRNG